MEGVLHAGLLLLHLGLGPGADRHDRDTAGELREPLLQIEKVLADHGCRPIETDGAAFDPTVHDAILEQPAPGIVPGTVVGTAVRGYTLQ